MRKLTRPLAWLSDWWHGIDPATFFNVHDLHRINALLSAHRVMPLSADPAQVLDGPDGAQRLIVGLLASQRRLRQRFPTALSAGPNGPFARWLTTRGWDELRLPAWTVDAFRAAFDQRPAQFVQRIVDTRVDLRHKYPLLLTPRHIGEFITWLIVHGRRDFGITAEQILWFVYTNAEDSSFGLNTLYRLTPEWQERFPHGQTQFGQAAFKRWLAERYAVPAGWLQRAELTPPVSPWDELRLLRQAKPERAKRFPWSALTRGETGPLITWTQQVTKTTPAVDWCAHLHDELQSGVAEQLSVNVVAHFRYISGLQEAAHKLVAGLQRHKVRTQLRDLPVVYSCDWRDEHRYDDVELADTSIIVAAANSFVDENYHRAGLRMREGVYRIGVWYWELETIPTEWVERMLQVQEVWAPTQFIADAMRRSLPLPVHHLPPGVELPQFRPRPRSHFGLEEQEFVFLFMFDMGSRLARKNPLGLIRAFGAAFQGDPNVRLVIKVTRGDSLPKDRDCLLAAAAMVPQVTIIDRVLARDETLALVNCCDSYVSLHRSEGLGLTMAEAMLLGKPTIATGYSGNVDFMTADNSLLVRYDRVPIEEEGMPYPVGCMWAEPDLNHAVELMRHVYDNPADAFDLGQTAKADLQQRLSIKSAGKRMVERLRTLRREGRSRVN
jgi:glycosyltransferase involved in cell wall biosynthesis